MIRRQELLSLGLLLGANRSGQAGRQSYTESEGARAATEEGGRKFGSLDVIILVRRAVRCVVRGGRGIHRIAPAALMRVNRTLSSPQSQRNQTMFRVLTHASKSPAVRLI